MAKMKYTGKVQDKSGDYESFRDSKKKEHLIAPATGKEKGAAGAGRGFVNPKNVDDDATRAGKEEAAEMQLQKKTTKAYDDVLKRKDSNSWEIDGDVN